jgi:hypothetical protein
LDNTVIVIRVTIITSTVLIAMSGCPLVLGFLMSLLLGGDTLCRERLNVSSQKEKQGQAGKSVTQRA